MDILNINMQALHIFAAILFGRQVLYGIIRTSAIAKEFRVTVQVFK